jgi:hypothetical protein
MQWKPRKADEAYTSRTMHRHSVHSDIMGNSHRALCEHTRIHDTQSEERADMLGTPADKEPNQASFGYRI